MNQISALVKSILDKVDAALTTEPARLIGYGAAVVVVLVVQLLGFIKPGLLPPVSFDEAIGLTFAAIATIVTVVESIRRFVYSPQTYIEDLADHYAAGHEEAHQEEEFNRLLMSVQAEQEAAAEAAKPKSRVAVGSTRAAGASDKDN